MYGTESRSRAKQEVARRAPAVDRRQRRRQEDQEAARRRARGLAPAGQDLEAFESERKAIATELKGTRQRLQYLLAVSPAIIYTTKATGDYACTFVSENLRAIMGYTPQEMTTDPKGWPDHLHPDDAPRAFGEMLPLIGRGGGASSIASATATGITFGSRTPSRSSMTMPVIRSSSSAHGPTSPSASRQNGTALEANAEIQETKRYLTRLIESSPDAIIATDKQGNVVLFNEGAETLARLSRRGGHWPPHHPALRQRGARERRAASRCASAAARLPATRACSRPRTGTAFPCSSRHRSSSTRTARKLAWSASPPISVRASARRKSFARRTTSWRSGSRIAPPN